MKLGLSCSENTEVILKELLTSRNISIEADSIVYLVESGYTIPTDKIVILFSLANISQLLEFLDCLKTSGDETEAIVGRTGDESYTMIPYKQICYFEARGNSVFGITVENEYRVKERLYELEARLPQKRFIRVGKSFIVNIGNVREIIPWFGRRLILRFNGCKNEIEVSKSYSKNFKEFLGL